jgi:hemerythrin-like domain-containing protein
MTSTLPLADTRDMKGLHNVFREALDAATQLVGTAADGDTRRAEYVGTYYDNVLRLLHGHHEGEDELLTPKLAERCTAAEAAEVRRIAGQHDGVLGDLAAAEAAVASWRAQPETDQRNAAVAALRQLQDSLAAHLAEEERVVLPIAARHINVAEWGELPAHGMRTFTGDKLWLIIGLVQEQMPAPAIVNMEAHMPPPVLEFWQSTGKRMFSDYIAVLRP